MRHSLSITFQVVLYFATRGQPLCVQSLIGMILRKVSIFMSQTQFNRLLVKYEIIQLRSLYKEQLQSQNLVVVARKSKKYTRRLDPDKRAQLECGKSTAATNLECAKFVVANGCKCSKNGQQTMMFVQMSRTYSVEIKKKNVPYIKTKGIYFYFGFPVFGSSLCWKNCRAKIPPYGSVNHSNMNGSLRGSHIIDKFTFEGFFQGSERTYIRSELIAATFLTHLNCARSFRPRFKVACLVEIECDQLYLLLCDFLKER